MEFANTELQLLLDSISKHRDKEGPLLPILHDCLEIFGSVPFEIQKIISKQLNVPVSKINSIVTYYDAFNIKKTADNNIEVCTGSSCFVRGSYKTLDEFERRLGVKANSQNKKYALTCVKCMGECHQGPNIKVNDKMHSNFEHTQVKEIIDKEIN